MAGLDIRNFKETGAALLHNNHDDRENFPKMIWPTNYGKLACATMFTLFFGGKAFAPKCNISLNDVDSNTSSTPPSAATTNIQDFLQQHYISAILQVVIRINAEPDLEDSVVVGYDTLNEPHFGWIGIEHADKFPIEQELKNGSTPTPFQAMLLGMGTACEVEKWSFTWYGPAKAGSETLDPKGARAWIMDDVIIEGKYRLEREKGCIWAAHGVWDQTTKTLLRPDYFHIHPSTGQPIDFLKDFFKPFVIKYTDAIRSIHKKAIIFVEPPVNEHPPTWSAKQGDPTERLAYAPHWYDGVTLLNKSFNKMFNVDFLSAKRGLYMSYATAVKFGERGIKTAFRNQLGLIKQEGQKYLGKRKKKEEKEEEKGVKTFSLILVF